MDVQKWIGRMKIINSYLPALNNGLTALIELQLVKIITKYPKAMENTIQPRRRTEVDHNNRSTEETSFTCKRRKTLKTDLIKRKREIPEKEGR